jgi:hypothetical protein
MNVQERLVYTCTSSFNGAWPKGPDDREGRMTILGIDPGFNGAWPKGQDERKTGMSQSYLSMLASTGPGRKTRMNA